MRTAYNNHHRITHTHLSRRLRLWLLLGCHGGCDCGCYLVCACGCNGNCVCLGDAMNLTHCRGACGCRGLAPVAAKAHPMGSHPQLLIISGPGCYAPEPLQVLVLVPRVDHSATFLIVTIRQLHHISHLTPKRAEHNASALPAFCTLDGGPTQI